VYAGLFNTRRGLSAEDFEKVGFLNAALMLRWSQWVHRRVELVRFTDEDVARRNVSVDFTLPWWYHEARGTPEHGIERLLVPLGLLRKGTLVNFDLRDESGSALPLLTTPQNGIVAEASLVTLAGFVLNETVPNEIRCDIRQLVSESANDAQMTLARLFDRRDVAAASRSLLRDDAVFSSVAEVLAKRFLALTMIDLRRHQRRVLHFAYDDSLWTESSANTVRGLVTLALGRPRSILFTIPAVADADSYHFEAEAPDGFQISTREGYSTLPSGALPARQITKEGSFQRSHLHFPQAESGAEGAVFIRLRPRPSNIVRGAVLAAALAFAAILFIRLRLGPLKSGPSAGAAAAPLLLAFPGLLSLYMARSDENPMATNLLWPVRVLALTPALWSFLAAAALIGGTTGIVTKVFLWAMVGLAGLSFVLLARTWRVLVPSGRSAIGP